MNLSVNQTRLLGLILLVAVLAMLVYSVSGGVDALDISNLLVDEGGFFGGFGGGGFGGGGAGGSW